VIQKLFKPISHLNFPQNITRLLTYLCGPTLKDLLFHVPFQGEKRVVVSGVKHASFQDVSILLVHIVKHLGRSHPKKPYRILAKDEQDYPLEIVFFNGQGNYFHKLIPEGATKYIAGKIEFFQNTYQMPHPTLVSNRLEGIPTFEPQYALTGGLTSYTLRQAVLKALVYLEDFPEWIHLEKRQSRGWLSFKESLTGLHLAKSFHDLDMHSPFRLRLAYDEFLHHHLSLGLLRKSYQNQEGCLIQKNSDLYHQCLSDLPYELTAGQKKVLSEIQNDISQGKRMARLLQGDVGSGKTIVAFLALLEAVASGFQGAFMVPTTLLAKQHYETLKPFAEKLGVSLGLLTGLEKGKKRKEILETLASGELKILIGTHALFQEAIVYQKLGLVIIDEQHRYGVHQRLMLQKKGQNTHMLVMTATPIPRTLLLGLYGDLDVSKLEEKPKGRKDITTLALTIGRLPELVERLKERLLQGERAYWVCPLIQESEKIDLQAAEARYLYLKEIFGDQVGLMHGRMKEADRDVIMEHFREGRISLLVSTTVIEVGIDVKEATFIIIEESERFGLAQLHQLRGRVGRGSKDSYCVLLHQEKLTEIARERLQAMRKSQNGFVIAEEDLRLRGGGDILGTRQSGLLKFQLGDLMFHQKIFQEAYDEVTDILNEDPELQLPKNQNVHILFELFQSPVGSFILQAG
jgi:ATP-dependent DNA helicase RecG